MSQRSEHWQRVFQMKEADEVSWTQACPERSLALIESVGIAKDAGVIDIGGGTSGLAGELLGRGYSNLAVLDLAGAALEKSSEKLGEQSAEVELIESDVTSFAPRRRYGLWHDRACFHFLTGADDRAAYW
jgi:trans-aconitate methyltransferase